MTRQTILLVAALVLTGVSGVTFASAQTSDNVEVTSFPFDVTVTEGNSITFSNSGDTTWNFVSYGWFDGKVAPDESLTIQLPVEGCSNTLDDWCYFAGDYYIKDLATGEYSVLRIVEPPSEVMITGDGTNEVHVYGIPFDVSVIENGKVVYHNNDDTYHNLKHNSEIITFSMWAGANGGTATANFPTSNCNTCFQIGKYDWTDEVTGVTGSITVLPDSDCVDCSDVLNQTKNFKNLIQAKIQAQIDPFKLEIAQLKEELSGSEDENLNLGNQVSELRTEVYSLRQNATVLGDEIQSLKQNATTNQQKFLDESRTNQELRDTIEQLRTQVTDTKELEKVKKDAANWKAVALEQLRIMAEVLGLF